MDASRRGDRLRLAVLVGCLLSSLALYGGLAVVLGNPPPGWDGTVGFSRASAPLFRGLTGLPVLALSPAEFSRAVGGALALLWVLWGAAVLALRGIAAADARRHGQRIVVAGCLAMLVVVVVTVPPLLSADLYRQSIYGRMAAHGINPYATAAATAVSDPVLALANQTRATTTYGPAYTWLSALAALLAPATPLGVALAWKITAALAALGCALLAAPTARALAAGGDGRDAQLWVAWNPLVVIEAAGSAHIEPIMMLPALAGILLVQRRRPLGGCLLLLVSMLTKWVTGVLLLFAAASEIRRAPAGARGRALAGLVGASGLLVALLYAPFAAGLASRGGVHDILFRGSSSFSDVSRGFLPQWVMMAAFGAVIAATSRYATGGDGPRLVATATALILLFVLVVLPWLFPWYLVAPLVLAAVLPPNRSGRLLRLITVGFGAGLMLYYAKLIPAR